MKKKNSIKLESLPRNFDGTQGNNKQAQETMLEKPTKDRKIPPKSIREEELRTQVDQNDPESEEEQ
jgi:hypothetical protein